MTEGRDFRRMDGGRPDLAALAGGVVHLADCDLSEADLSGLHMGGWWFQRCQFRAAKVMQAVLDGAIFEGCRGAFADFRAARLAEASPRGSDFNSANFGEVVLTGARIAGCKLTGADLGGLTLVDAGRFKGATVPRAQAADLLAQRGLQVR